MWDCDEIDFDALDGTQELAVIDRLDLARDRYEGATISPDDCKREQLRKWLASIGIRYQFGVTINFKSHVRTANNRGTWYHKLSKNDYERVAEQFMKRLNLRVLGNEAKRRGGSLFFLPVLERGVLRGEYHLHIAIAGFRDMRNWWRHTRDILHVTNGLEEIRGRVDIDFEPNHSIANYLTKTVKENDLEMVLWNRCPEHMRRRVGVL